ncbi:MAG: DUF4276 family protein [Armatimonadota bacterium]
MAVLVPIVEGDGEVDAVPLLLRRLLYEFLRRFDLEIGPPKNAHGRTNLTTRGGIERFVRYALKEPEAAGVIVLVDADDDIPCALACHLRHRIEALSPSIPAAVVCAERQYESWFVESIETLRGKCDLCTDAEWPASRPPNPKAWLRDRMPATRTYKETSDQVSLTSELDFSLLAERSRSFRRMRHAVEELVEAHDTGTSSVTPLRCDPEANG